LRNAQASKDLPSVDYSFKLTEKDLSPRRERVLIQKPPTLGLPMVGERLDGYQ
jgi:hypothetical protein